MAGPVDPLDNPVWHSLRATHAGLAEGDGRALRYRPLHVFSTNAGAVRL